MSFTYKQGLVRCQGLDASELAEIKQLAELCNQHEGLDLKLNWSTLRSRPVDTVNDFLFYADGQLVGFLPLFSFNAQEGEISGMVHPAYRRRGIFTQLFEAARQESVSRGLSTLLLIVEQASPAGQAFAKGLSTTYDHSEYKMVLGEPQLSAVLSERLLFRVARSADLPLLSRITAQAFAMPDDAINYTDQLLGQPNQYYYVGEIDGVVIGKIDVFLTDEAALILGFVVVPELRGQGYGRQILTHTVQELVNMGRQNVWLEVLTENRRALSLYQSCGFNETGSYDYYRLLLG